MFRIDPKSRRGFVSAFFVQKSIFHLQGLTIRANKDVFIFNSKM